MAAPHISGYGGTVVVPGTTIDADIMDWTIRKTVERFKGRVKGQAWEEVGTGAKGWSATLRFLLPAAVVTADLNAILNTSGTFTFTYATNKAHSGTAIILDVNVEDPIDNYCGVTLEIAGNDATGIAFTGT